MIVTKLKDLDKKEKENDRNGRAAVNKKKCFKSQIALTSDILVGFSTAEDLKN